jgi:hypothetical protein
MANRNFNKQVIPARTKLAAGGPSSDTGKRGGMGPMGPRVKPLPRFKKKDTTDREKIIRDRILNNKLKDKLKDFGKDRPTSQEPRKKQRPGSPRPMPIKPRDRTVDRMPMPREIDKMQPRQPMPTMPGRPRKPGPSRPMPKLPGKPRRPDLIKKLTPEQIKRLKDIFKNKRKKRKELEPKNSLKDKMQRTGRPKPKGRKKLMGGGSASSREAMMHGFYNKDMGMGKKKK